MGYLKGKLSPCYTSATEVPFDQCDQNPQFSLTIVNNSKQHDLQLLPNDLSPVIYLNYRIDSLDRPVWVEYVR